MALRFMTRIRSTLAARRKDHSGANPGEADPGEVPVVVRRQHRSSLMMRAVPGGFEVYIPRWLAPDHPQVRAFIRDGLQKMGGRALPVPAEQTSRAEINRMIETWAARIGVAPKRVQFRQMQRKWGSCSSRENITLNTRLCWLPPRLAEYIVVHELVHLRVFNHGPEFKSQMSLHLPDWREREAELNRVAFSAPTDGT